MKYIYFFYILNVWKNSLIDQIKKIQTNYFDIILKMIQLYKWLFNNFLSIYLYQKIYIQSEGGWMAFQS